MFASWTTLTRRSCTSFCSNRSRPCTVVTTTAVYTSDPKMQSSVYRYLGDKAANECDIVRKQCVRHKQYCLDISRCFAELCLTTTSVAFAIWVAPGDQAWAVGRPKV